MRFATVAATVEGIVEEMTRGNPTEVKVVLASVALALATYQLFLIAVAYEKVKLRLLQSPVASFVHRASGDVIAALLAGTAAMCVAYFGFESDYTFHIVAGCSLLAVLALKIAVVRWWEAAGWSLPWLGTCVWVLLAATWASSAGSFLA